MENLKPTQNHEQEQPTPEYDVVKTFSADTTNLDNARYPLTIIRSGQDGEDVRPDGGWIPGDMLCVCNTDSEEGIGTPELFLRVHKPIKINGEYTVAEEIVALDSLQSLKENGSFTEFYIQARYGKSTEEMLKEGTEAAEQIWRQKYPANNNSESSTTETRQNFSDDSAVEKVSDHERPSMDKVGPVMGGVAVKAAGVREPVETNKVDTNEPVREPVETDKTGVGSPALKIPGPTMELIRATEVNDSVGSSAVEPAKKPAETDKVGANPADLVAAEPVKKPVEADKASAAPADLPAVESAKNPVETNEANTDILPESFKSVINDFEKDTRDNNNQFAGVARSLTGSLSELRELIIGTPAAIKDPRTTEFITNALNALPSIKKLEASRAGTLNSFIDEGFSKEMFVDSKKDPAKATGILVSKLAGLGEILGGVYAGYSGRDSLVQVIGEIIVDLSTVSRYRWDILDAVNKIKSVWGDDKS